MTYTNIPPISYIFVGITTAILSYVTWAESQEVIQPEFQEEEEAQTKIQEEETQSKIQEEETQSKQMLMGGKKRTATKRKRNRRKKQTKHKKLKTR
jgi:flagellar biosynthesis component FlhA